MKFAKKIKNWVLEGPRAFGAHQETQKNTGNNIRRSPDGPRLFFFENLGPHLCIGLMIHQISKIILTPKKGARRPTTHARTPSPLPFFWTYFRPDWPKISPKKWKRRPKFSKNYFFRGPPGDLRMLFPVFFWVSWCVPNALGPSKTKFFNFFCTTQMIR